MTRTITAAASCAERLASLLVLQIEVILHKQLDSGSLRARHAAMTALHDLAPRLGPALQRSLPRLVGRLLDCISEPSREVGPLCCATLTHMAVKSAADRIPSVAGARSS